MVQLRIAVSTMHFAERRALASLREARANKDDERDDLEARAFSHLARILADANAEIRATGAPFASADELTFLSSIASMQRPTGVPRGPRDPLLMHAVECCAQALKALGYILPHRSIARMPLPLGRTETRGLPRARNDPDEVGQSPSSSVASGAHKANSVAARAIALAKSKDVVSTHSFRAVGISRQMISKLRKDGFLVRVQHGLYRWSGRAESPAR